MIQRVTLITSELRPGGAERVVVHLAQGLRQLGVESGIICLQQPGELAEEALAAGVPVTSLGSRRGYDVAAISSLSQALRRARPDAINVHDRASLPYVVIANRLAGRRPIILSCHGLLLQDRGTRRFRDVFFARDVQVVTAVSDQSAKEYADILDWAGQVPVLRNGVPAMRRDPALACSIRHELGLDPDTVVFLAVGNVKPEKGFEDLLAAASRLRDVGGKQFVVLIAGAMDGGEYGQRLQTLHSDLQLGQIARFLGRRRDTAALYSAADVFVLSSRTEGLPMALLEAMSAGLATVATRVGAVPEVLSQECGLLASPGNVEELAGAMRQLMGDALLRTRLGEAGRQIVSREYSVARMAEEYLSVYGQACSRLRRPPAGTRRAQADHLRPRVLMLGPLPPLTGGMATVIENLMASDLARQVELHAMNNGKTTREGRTLLEGVIAQLRLLADLARQIARLRIDIVHIHTCEFMGFWRDCVHALQAGLSGCHVVWHIHGARFDQWAAKLDPVRRTLLRAALEWASGVIVLSEEWLTKLRPFGSNARWWVVENGIPIPASCPPLPDGPATFLFLGDWTPRKGVLDLVSAVDLATKNHGFHGVVRLAGFEKDPGQRARLDRAIADSGCEDRLEVLGLVSGARKDEVIRESHCLVLPSYGEGLPMAILEAMGQGRTVIATRVGAIPGLIADGRNGFLIEPGDVNGLAQILAMLASDRNLLQRAGLAARRRVEECYSMEVACKAILSIYREVLKRRKEVTEA